MTDYRLPVTETNEQIYTEALECLPPQNWHTLPGGGEFFQMCEYYAENYTTYHVGVLFSDKSKPWFTFRDHAWLNRQDVRKLIDDFLLGEALMG